jgi:RNA polymerase sigma-70 factor (ECF subfamily)
MDSTSVSLLEQIRLDPEAQAWRRFTDLYTPLLYYWAKRLGLQQTDAADLVQDVFLLLVRKLPGFNYDRSRSFRGWLHTLLLNQFRTARRKPPVATLASDNSALAAAAGGDQAEACWRQVVDGRTAAEVAAELGISEGAAYVAKCRVLRRLREELDGLLD